MQITWERALGDFLSLSVSAVFEDVWSLNSGLFIGNAVDRGAQASQHNRGKLGPFWLFSLSALNLCYFLITKYSYVAYQQAMDSTTQPGFLRLVSLFKSIMKTKTGC